MLEAATGKRGGAGGGLLVDSIAGTKLACLAGSAEISFHPNHTSFLPSSSFFPAFLFLVLLPPAGYRCENEALMGWADSTDKRVNWLVGCTYAYTFPHRGTLSFQHTLNWSTMYSCTHTIQMGFFEREHSQRRLGLHTYTWQQMYRQSQEVYQEGSCTLLFFSASIKSDVDEWQRLQDRLLLSFITEWMQSNTESQRASRELYARLDGGRRGNRTKTVCT